MAAIVSFMDSDTGFKPNEKNHVFHVVLGDDEAEFRGWLRELFDKSPGFSVIGEASTGNEAIRLAGQLTPDMLIVEVYLPGGDALDVARYLRYNQPGVKLVLTTGAKERCYDRLAEEEGAVAFITKARLSPEAVLEALRAAE